MGDLRVGTIARCDDTGLGVQTWETWRHLKPDVTVVVDFSRLPAHLTQHRDRYPGALFTTWKGVGFHFDNIKAMPALRSCDVVFSVETFYDLRVHEQAKAAVLYVNPELFRGYGSPTYWAPTDWLHDRLPAGTRVVPFPVAADRPWRRGEGFLHVAGRNASYDRNGTRPAADATKRIGHFLRMLHQVDMPSIQGAIQLGAEDNYWDVYSHGDVLVMPRRYGGMCLPVQEALAAGLQVVMTDIAPNPQWPVELVGGALSTVKTVGPDRHNRIPAMDVDVVALAECLRTVVERRDETLEARRAWVESHSWTALLPVWREALEDAANE